MNFASLANLAAGFVTAAAEEAAPSLLGKATNVANHDVGTFVQHNPTLAPIVTDLGSYLDGVARSHGLDVVANIVEGLLPFLAQTPHTTVSAPAA